MEKCEICGRKGDIKVGTHTYCAVHYVENEDKECIYWHFHGIMIKKQVNKHERKILSEIRKKYPQFMERFKKERQKELDYYDRLKRNLIKIYEGYLKNPADKSLKKKAKILHKEFLNAMPLLNKNMQHAINLLVDIGWDLPTPSKPTKKVVKEVLRKLKGADSD